MEQYFAECTWCGWESAAAADQESAGQLGIDHAGTVHGAADQTSALAALRVRYYYTVTAPQPIEPETKPATEEQP